MLSASQVSHRRPGGTGDRVSVTSLLLSQDITSLLSVPAPASAFPSFCLILPRDITLVTLSTFGCTVCSAETFSETSYFNQIKSEFFCLIFSSLAWLRCRTMYRPSSRQAGSLTAALSGGLPPHPTCTLRSFLLLCLFLLLFSSFLC